MAALKLKKVGDYLSIIDRKIGRKSMQISILSFNWNWLAFIGHSSQQELYVSGGYGAFTKIDHVLDPKNN